MFNSLKSTNILRIVSPDLIVVGHSGFTAINRNVYNKLAKCGWHVELVIPQFIPSFKNRGADPKRPEDPTIHWVKVRGSNQRFWFFEGMIDILKFRRPRAVLLEADPASRLAISLSIWANRENIPLLCYTNENTITPFWRSVFKADVPAAARTLRSLLMTRLTRGAVTRVFVLCDAAAASMAVLGFKDRTYKMPLGFDSEIFHPDPEARELIRARLGLRYPVIAYIGRMVPGKGVEFLIEALSGMLNLDWHLLIDDFNSSEQGDYADQIEKQLAANPAVAARTQRFHADHFEVAAYMNASDMLVAPSCLPEQYGRVLAEAMACGKVVVASDAGAYPELVGDCGVIFPKANTEALMNTLRDLLQNPSMRSHFESAAAARAIQELSMSTQIAILDRHVGNLLSSGCADTIEQS
jgi:glycosyltransferase involved in cell wall biosynthesis